MKNILTFVLILINGLTLAQSKLLNCSLEFPFVYNEDSIASNGIKKIVIDEYANRKNWKELGNADQTFCKRVNNVRSFQISKVVSYEK